MVSMLTRRQVWRSDLYALYSDNVPCLERETKRVVQVTEAGTLLQISLTSRFAF